MGRALVLSGGGVTGIAWELGVIAGQADAGVDVTAAADLIVGTSAGAAVAAFERSGSRVLVAQADADALAAMGDNPLDPAFRSAAIDEGLRQGRLVAASVRDGWLGRFDS